MSQEHSIDIFLGLDVGKSEHHACALNRAGNKVFDKPLPQLESKLAGVFHQLQELGTVLVVADQPNTIGALPIAVARNCGCQVAYLPGLAMRKAADLYPGRAKTDQTQCFHHRRHRPHNAAHTPCRRPKQRSSISTEDAVRLR